MTNAIVSAVCQTLSTAFGDGYTYYKESVAQGLQEPCFFIAPLEVSCTRFMGQRYFQSVPISVTFLPDPLGLDKVEVCDQVAAHLCQCLELITVEDAPLRGTQMGWQISDGALYFTVTYNEFVRCVGQAQEMMGALELV